MDFEAIKTLFQQQNTFATNTGIEIMELSSGTAKCVMPIRDSHRNLFGTVNAGAIYTLAETAFGIAANSHGYAAVASNLTIAYVKPATNGTLTAHARERSTGGRLAVFSVEVLDDHNELVAEVQATAYRTKRKLEDI
jgi:acyl-CoA thioesterase